MEIQIYQILESLKSIEQSVTALTGFTLLLLGGLCLFAIAFYLEWQKMHKKGGKK